MFRKGLSAPPGPLCFFFPPFFSSLSFSNQRELKKKKKEARFSCWLSARTANPMCDDIRWGMWFVFLFFFFLFCLCLNTPPSASSFSSLPPPPPVGGGAYCVPWPSSVQKEKKLALSLGQHKTEHHPFSPPPPFLLCFTSVIESINKTKIDHQTFFFLLSNAT